jgi:hypothetical protein
MLEAGPPSTRRLHVAGWAAIAGGLAWVAIGALRQESLAGPIYGLTHEDIGRATPVAVMLLMFGLRGAHLVHIGRAGGLERWGYRLAITGLALMLSYFVVDRWLIGERSPPITYLPLTLLVPYVVILAGLLLFGVGTLRARVLPIWAKPLPLLIGPALIVGSMFVRIGSIDGFGWAALGAGVLLTPVHGVAAASTRPSPSPREVRQAFLSRATLVSGVLAVGVWSLEWSWIVGVLVVLLLYAHEAGHVLAAFWRGIQVKKAPMFLPGFGAFVETAPGATAWDEAWMSLGGPLFGGACALAVKLQGIQFGIPELAHAGDFALIINLLNLAPFSPLDGGRVARSTGWLGVLLTIGLGIFLLIQDVGLFLSALIILAGLQAIGTVRQNRAGLVTHIGIFGVYLVCVGALLLAYVLSGRVVWLASTRPTWLPGLDSIFEAVFWIYLAGLVAMPFAWRSGQTAVVRYGILALLGWPSFLFQRKLWMIGVSVALAGESLGLPGAAWTRRYAGSLARRGDPAGGAAAAYAFDALVRKGDPLADVWLESLRATLAAGGEPVTSAVAQTLAQLGYDRSAKAWRSDAARTVDEDMVAEVEPDMARP